MFFICVRIEELFVATFKTYHTTRHHYPLHRNGASQVSVSPVDRNRYPRSA